ncbi:MAG: DNA starvation/stationary phase protection protein [Bacteroidetes bacterium]|nr:DNA starvation/stationary phase protection protein [Bacteroidota bacterium]
MKNVEYLGLKTDVVEDVTDRMNTLLGNYQIYYMNVRGFHWNIKGDMFFELHEKFEELYTDALKKIDEIAERVKTLGATPVHSFSDYVEDSSIKEKRNITSGREAAESILDSLKILIEIERDVLSYAYEAKDEATIKLMGKYLTYQEKQVWMFNAFLGNK